MKKSLVLMAMAGVALAGCVNDVADVAQSEQKKALISFQAPVTYNNNSRVNVYGSIGSHVYGEGVNQKTYQYPREEKIRIYAISHSSDFSGWSTSGDNQPLGFNGQVISYDQSSDSWAPKTTGNGYYTWPQGKKMSYAAFSPAELDKFYDKSVDSEGNVSYTENTTVNLPSGDNAYDYSYGANGLKVENFKTPLDPAYQYDFLFSKLEINKTSANMNHNADYYSGAPIQFQHALSSVLFSIENDSDRKVFLHSIKLWGVKVVGTFEEDIKTPSSGWSGWTYNRNNSNIVEPKWTPGSTTNEQSNAFVVYKPAVASVGAEFPIEAQYVSAVMPKTDTYHELFLIPQTLTNDVTVQVKYYYDDDKDNILTSTKQLKGLRKVHDNGTINESGDEINVWNVGHRYTYRLYLSDAAVKKDKILFSPKTEGWIPVNAAVVYLSSDNVND